MRLCLWFLPLLAPPPSPPSSRRFAGAPDTSAFRRLELPAPNTIRTGSGAPGPDYWQQRVDYVIRATLDTVDPLGAGRGADHLHQQLAGHPPLPLAAARPERVQQPEPGRPDVRSPEPVRRPAGAEGGVRILKVAQPAVAAARGRAASPARASSTIW